MNEIQCKSKFLCLLVILLASCSTVPTTLEPEEKQVESGGPTQTRTPGVTHTPAITPTRTSTLPSPPEIPESSFVVPDSPQILPEDILEEVWYYGGGGGGFASDFHYCQNESTPQLSFGLAQMTELELSLIGDSPVLVTCGWEEKEGVVITVSDQDGSFQWTGDNAWSDSWDPDDPIHGYLVALDQYLIKFGVGEYQILFEGESGIVETRLIVVPTNTIRVERDDDEIILSGVVPDDVVRVIYYPYDERPILNSFPTGQSDVLRISGIPEVNGTYAIYSDHFGYITTLSSGFGSTSGIKCGDALATQTRPGQWLHLATFLQGDGLWLFATADRNSSVTGFIPYDSPHGPYVRTISEPFCGENSVWWKVQSLDNQVGWAIESDEHSYYLIDEGSHATGICGHHFSIGQVVRVTFTDGAPLNLRQSPGFSARGIGLLSEGTRLTILDGADCRSDGVWWYVETENDSSGWVLESDNQVDYLEGWK